MVFRARAFESRSEKRLAAGHFVLAAGVAAAATVVKIAAAAAAAVIVYLSHMIVLCL